MFFPSWLLALFSAGLQLALFSLGSFFTSPMVGDAPSSADPSWEPFILHCIYWILFLSFLMLLYSVCLNYVVNCSEAILLIKVIDNDDDGN